VSNQCACTYNWIRKGRFESLGASTLKHPTTQSRQTHPYFKMQNPLEPSCNEQEVSAAGPHT